MPRTDERAKGEPKAQTLSQALAARGRARSATPPPSTFAATVQPPTRRWGRIVARTLQRLVALAVLGGAVAAVWLWAIHPALHGPSAASARGSAHVATPLGKRAVSLVTGGFTPSTAAPLGVPGFATLHVSVVDASGKHRHGPGVRRYLHQLGLHPVPFDRTGMELKKSIILYKPGWASRGIAFARLLGLHAEQRHALPGVPARQPLVLVVGDRGI